MTRTPEGQSSRSIVVYNCHFGVWKWLRTPATKLKAAQLFQSRENCENHRWFASEKCRSARKILPGGKLALRFSGLFVKPGKIIHWIAHDRLIFRALIWAIHAINSCLYKPFLTTLKLFLFVSVQWIAYPEFQQPNACSFIFLSNL